MGAFKLELQSGNNKFGSKSAISLSRVTLKFDRWPWKTIGHLFCATKLCASFQSHWWIQIWVTIRKHSIPVKIGHFLSRVTLKFDGRSKKNNRAHLLCCFKLCASFHSHQWISNWSSVRKRQILVKINVFCPVRPWNLTDDPENNRVPLLCYFKLCASFQSHWWIQTGFTVRKRPIWVKIDDIFSPVTFKFDGWLWKSIGHLS